MIIPRIQRQVRNEVLVIALCSIATAATAVAYVLVRDGVLQILLINVAMFFLIGVLPIYWSVATARMSGLMAAAGLAFINTVGLLGGFIGPYLYGWVEEASGARASAFVVIVGFSLLGILLLPILHRGVQRENRATLARSGEEQPEPRAHLDVQASRR